jgi:hypothetical protein
MIPIVHRMEMFATNPITSRMAPKTINGVLFLPGARGNRAGVDLAVTRDTRPHRA